MVTPESIHELLSAASARLDAAMSQVSELALAPIGANLHRIARATRAIEDVQREIYRLRPDLLPATALEDLALDGPLDEAARARVDALQPAQLELIDRTLLAGCDRQFRKVAFVVGRAICELAPQLPGIPDVFYAMRVAHLVELGQLEAIGDLRSMRRSEVRR